MRVLLHLPVRAAAPHACAAAAARRAEIRSLCGGVVFDFSLTDANGHIPSMAAVQKAFTEVRGHACVPRLACAPTRPWAAGVCTCVCVCACVRAYVCVRVCVCTCAYLFNM